MRRAVFVLLTLTAVGIAARPAAASCVGPELKADRSTAAPGDLVRLSGAGFFVGCNDTLTPGQTTLPPTPADHGIHIQFREGDQSIDLVTVDASADFTFNVPVHIPASAAGGKASIVATGANGAPSVDLLIGGSGGPSPSRAVPLARTGFSVTELLVASGLLALGAVLLTVASFCQLVTLRDADRR